MLLPAIFNRKCRCCLHLPLFFVEKNYIFSLWVNSRSSLGISSCFLQFVTCITMCLWHREKNTRTHKHGGNFHFPNQTLSSSTFRFAHGIERQASKGNRSTIPFCAIAYSSFTFSSIPSFLFSIRNWIVFHCTRSESKQLIFSRSASLSVSFCPSACFVLRIHCMYTRIIVFRLWRQVDWNVCK